MINDFKNHKNVTGDPLTTLLSIDLNSIIVITFLFNPLMVKRHLMGVDREIKIYEISPILPYDDDKDDKAVHLTHRQQQDQDKKIFS